MPTLELSPQVFSILSSLIRERVGISYSLLEKDILQDKVSSRAQDAGFESLLDYYYYLRYDDSGDKELSQLVESLVVNETYFFREWPAIEVLVEKILMPLCEAGVKPKVWSAACATGEEPLSLAMLLDEKGILDQVEIVASDISENALNKARSGRFGRRSVRSIPNQNIFEKYIQDEGDHYTVDLKLREAISWQKLNILDQNDYPSSKPFDVILCRNLLIYFSDETVNTVLQNLWNALNPNSLLLVGVSESLLRFGSNFIGEEHGGTFFYRKGLNSEL